MPFFMLKKNDSQATIVRSYMYNSIPLILYPYRLILCGNNISAVNEAYEFFTSLQIVCLRYSEPTQYNPHCVTVVFQVQSTRTRANVELRKERMR